MKVLLAPVGTEGDVRPLASLARKLQAAGHQTRFLVSPDLVEIAHSVGVEAFPVGPPLKPVMEKINAAGNGNPIRALKAMSAALRQAIGEQFNAHAPHAAWADLLVGSAPMQFATSAFAEKFGIPGVMIGHVGAIVPSRFQAPPNAPSGLPSPLNRLIWGASFGLMELVLGKSLRNERAKIGLGPMLGGLRRQRPPMIVAMDPELWSIPRDAYEGVRQTGYFRLPDQGELPREIEAFLEAGEAPVYVGFGSMAQRDAAETGRIIAGALRSTGMRAVVAKGWSGEMASDDRLLVCGHVPHTKLFPRMSVVAHHGGAGTSWTASRSGTPQVVVPHMMDQPEWARRLHAMGLAAKPIPCRKLTAARLAESLVEAREIGRGGAREAMSRTLAARDGLAEAVAILEELAGRK